MTNEQKRTDSILEYFVHNKIQLEKLSKEERDDLMSLACTAIYSDYGDNVKSKAVSVLYQAAFLEDISLEEAWEIYWIITSITFANPAVVLLEGSLVSLYKYIFYYVRSVIGTERPYRELETRNMDCIVVIVGQFLSVSHAPTLRALDYSYTMQKHLHKKVILINSSETNFYTNPHLEPCSKFNYISSYSDMEQLLYKEEAFEFYQVNSQMPNLAEMKKLVDNIYSINPLMVYNIGASNITTDLCSQFTTTASLPCSNQLPITCSKYLLLGRRLEEQDAPRLAALESNQRVVETEINYIIRENDTVYTREQFGIREDVFLATVIGNRLDEELTAGFMELLNRITSTGRIEIAIVGVLSDAVILSEIEKNDRLHYLGRLADASEFLKKSDLYLNPHRNGGGRSSFEALHYGTPVVTLAYGDVYYTCGKEFAINDYQEMYDTVLKHQQDYEFNGRKKREALKRADNLSDLKYCIKTAIDTIIDMESRN